MNNENACLAGILELFRRRSLPPRNWISSQLTIIRSMGRRSTPTERHATIWPTISMNSWKPKTSLARPGTSSALQTMGRIRIFPTFERSQKQNVKIKMVKSNAAEFPCQKAELQTEGRRRYSMKRSPLKAGLLAVLCVLSASSALASFSATNWPNLFAEADSFYGNTGITTATTCNNAGSRVFVLHEQPECAAAIFPCQQPLNGSLLREPMV